MDLNFNKVGEVYVAEFEVSADFNLHIEKSIPGSLRIYQRSAGDRYDLVRGASISATDMVVDYDFIGSVYPKSIMIESAVAPSCAILTLSA